MSAGPARVGDTLGQQRRARDWCLERVLFVKNPLSGNGDLR